MRDPSPVTRRVRLIVLALAVGAVLSAAACADADKPGGGDRLSVVAAFYPLQFLAERIGGDRVAVTTLVPPGAEPHDLELQPQQLATLRAADVVIHLAGFQPAVDEAIAEQATGGAAFDAAAVQPLLDGPAVGETETAEPAAASAGHDGRAAGKDPHIWLDPIRFAAVADALADRLARADAAHAGAYRDRATALRADLEHLDGEYAAGLTTCARRELVTSHAAFGYLAARYRLTQVPISGLSPEEEPTPQRVAEVAALARAKGVTTIFFETLVSPRIAETLAREVGATAEMLDPIEGLQAGTDGDYLSVMRANLARLRQALGCT